MITKMPDRSEKIERLNAEAGEYELPYLSKSRIMQWQKDKEHFRLKYLEGYKEKETGAMVRGTEIHESIEAHYHNQRANTSAELWDESLLPDDRTLWADHIEEFTNFLNWESDRRASVHENFLPLGVEEEVWHDPVLGLDGEPEWMGIADAVLPSASVPSIDADEGVTIVDFKTGSVPEEQYRDDGILMELAYYEIVFSEKYDVTGTAAYYPTPNEIITRRAGTENASEHTERVLSAAESMIKAVREYEGNEKFEHEPGPLCKWGTGDDEESAFYRITDCVWGVPADHPDTFEALVEDGYGDSDIAAKMGTTVDAVNYWKYKMDL